MASDRDAERAKLSQAVLNGVMGGTTESVLNAISAAGFAVLTVRPSLPVLTAMADMLPLVTDKNLSGYLQGYAQTADLARAPDDERSNPHG